MVVIAIGALLLAISVPAFNAINRGAELTRAGQSLVDELNAARQSAITKNHAVEVRFYRFAADGGAPRWSGFQTLLVDNDTGAATPLGRPRLLAPAVRLAADRQLSPLLGREKPFPDGEPPPALPGIGADYTVSAFRFQPDGSTDLPPYGQWFVTILSARLADNLAALPPDYCLVQVNPLTGAVQTYRP